VKSSINREGREAFRATQGRCFGAIVQLDGSDGGGGTATGGKKTAPARIHRRGGVWNCDKPLVVRLKDQDGGGWPGQMTLGNQGNDTFVSGMMRIVMNRRMGPRVGRQEGDEQQQQSGCRGASHADGPHSRKDMGPLLHDGSTRAESAPPGKRFFGCRNEA
jgi:hypothetical protein